MPCKAYFSIAIVGRDQEILLALQSGLLASPSEPLTSPDLQTLWHVCTARMLFECNLNYNVICMNYEHHDLVIS